LEGYAVLEVQNPCALRSKIEEIRIRYSLIEKLKHVVFDLELGTNPGNAFSRKDLCAAAALFECLWGEFIYGISLCRRD
jgi:hypothetical protein